MKLASISISVEEFHGAPSEDRGAFFVWLRKQMPEGWVCLRPKIDEFKYVRAPKGYDLDREYRISS